MRTKLNPDHMKNYFTSFLFSLALLISTSISAQKLPSGPQVLSFHSDADDTEQPYALYLPKNFDETKAYPFVMMLHGAGSNHRLALKRVFGKTNTPGQTDVEASRYFEEWEDVDYIVAAPYARGTAGYQGIPENDIMQVLEDVKSRFKIDENRMFLTGLSMGGGGTLWIGLTRPDIWAAIAPVCPAPPQGTEALIGNALNFPVHFFHGDADPAVSVEVSRNWVKNMKDLGIHVEYDEYPGVLHDSWANAYENGKIFKWFDQFEKNSFPETISFSTHQLKYNTAYWATINQKTPGQLATLKASIERNNKLNINTLNILEFTLDLNSHPSINQKANLELNIDDQKLKISAGSNLTFSKENGQWKQGPGQWGLASKSNKQEGPIYNAFAGRHVYVFGTEDNPSNEEIAKRRAIAVEAANWSFYRGEFLGRMMFFPRVLSDKEVRESDLKEANLILFGDKNSNKWIKEMSNELPMHLDNNQNEYGLFYIFPNKGRYVAISSGLPWWSGAENQGFPFVSLTHRQLPEFKDFILFKGSTANVVSTGHFDLQWQLSDEDRKNLQNSGVIKF